MRRPAHAVFGDIFTTQTNIPLDRSAKQKDFLQHDRKVLAQRFEIPVTQVNAVEQNPAALDVVETHQQIRDRSLAGTGVTDERDRLSGFDRERHIFQHPVFVVVSEPNVLKLNSSVGALGFERFLRRDNRERQVERPEDTM